MNRIDIMDWQLNSLKSQHHSVEHENSHRGSLLDHTTQTLSLLEQENTKFQKVGYCELNFTSLLFSIF